jgi:hypothetical protein
MKRVAGDVRIRPMKVWVGDTADKIEVAEGQRAIVREATDDDSMRVLGFTSERWQADSYHELAGALDGLAKHHKVETAGILEGGALAFLSLRGEDWTVLGKDEMRSYFLLNLSLKPGKGHDGMHTPIRAICWNTNTYAIEKSNIRLSIPHGADAKQQIGIVGHLLERFRQAQQETQRIFDEMAKTPAPIEAVEGIIGAAYPDPAMPAKLRLIHNVVGDEAAEVFKGQLDPKALQSLVEAEERWQRRTESMAQRREAAHEQYEVFEPAELRGSIWAAYNAVTETSDWRKGRGSAVGSLYGNRAAEKSRAFVKALSIVEGGGD